MAMLNACVIKALADLESVTVFTFPNIAGPASLYLLVVNCVAACCSSCGVTFPPCPATNWPKNVCQLCNSLPTSSFDTLLSIPASRLALVCWYPATAPRAPFLTLSHRLGFLAEAG